jgi:hypothetical protein
MVSSLLLSGREEIAADSARRTREAESRLDEAARRADVIVGAARTEVAAALAERERRLAGARASGPDVLVLTDDELRAAATRLLAPPTDPMPVPAPVAAPRMVSSAVEAPAEQVHASTGSMEMEPVEAPAPEPTTKLSPPVSAVAAEEARTDAAFDVWMAVAPATETGNEIEREASTPEEVPEPVVAGDEHRPRTRSRWILPLEVAAALLVAAILVVVLLVIIG